jgi:hypothetical protein
MVGQILPNNNESATGIPPTKILGSEHALSSLERSDAATFCKETKEFDKKLLEKNAESQITDSILTVQVC